jgi:hypothetical protein
MTQGTQARTELDTALQENVSLTLKLELARAEVGRLTDELKMVTRDAENVRFLNSRLQAARQHELNYPATILMLLDVHRHCGGDVDKLLANIEELAHKAGLQLRAINNGETLKSTEINARYAAGTRFK